MITQMAKCHKLGRHFPIFSPSLLFQITPWLGQPWPRSRWSCLQVMTHTLKPPWLAWVDMSLLYNPPPPNSTSSSSSSFADSWVPHKKRKTLGAQYHISLVSMETIWNNLVEMIPLRNDPFWNHSHNPPLMFSITCDKLCWRRPPSIYFSECVKLRTFWVPVYM